MKDPNKALAAARARAAAQPASDLEAGDLGLDLSPTPELSFSRLAEWAMIEPDQAEVYSTRRLGRPITAFKRLLVRFLRQYLVQVSAQQSRFNAQVAAHIVSLDERLRALERTGGERHQSTAAGERHQSTAGERDQ